MDFIERALTRPRCPACDWPMVESEEGERITGGWKSIVESAKDAYWKARRDGKDETASLLAALDVALADSQE